MLPLSPALFIAAASALLPRDESATMVVGENSPADHHPRTRDNHGPDDGVTTAAFIAHTGYWSHRSEFGNSSWPFALDADCDRLAQVAADCGVVTVGRPHLGAILLRWSTREQRFTRASIVLEAKNVPVSQAGGWSYDCRVIEGSAQVSCIEARYQATLHWTRWARRRCCPTLGDRFVSWVDLDARGETVRVRRMAA